ncbi:MAG: sigma-70 family RNA polymerase sigma factor [Luteolibacter sp.]|uniref:RNA polymerase sigma factor n=1 Tax=Luteolibacter sp. TaxID=1962973 RepID=UPI00326622D5
MSEHLETDDSTLLNDFRDKRSDAAFTELVRRHLPLVFHVARRRLGSAALAEEAAQNAFARLAAKAAAVSHHPERLRAWLHRTAYFEASTLARKETRLSRLPIPPPSTTEPMNRPEIYDHLDEALSKLPELDRELVLRHCCGGEDYRRMAAEVGKSEAACQKRVERALGRLGQGLGAARSAGVVIAALATLNSKSSAMPAAERIAQAALQASSLTTNTVSAVTGFKLAACAVMVMAGAAAGWKTESKADSTREPMTVATVRTKSNRERTPVSISAPLPPRPAPVSRSLDQILESIQAGRLLPLVEYLPQASAADLQAIMAEDDTRDLSEGMGSFQLAHTLAAKRWAEIEPEKAFAYGVYRSTPLAARMLARWMAMDPGSAAEAFRALPRGERIAIARAMVDEDDRVAGKLAAADPSMAWVVAEERMSQPDLETEEQDAAARIARLVDSPGRAEPDEAETNKIRNAFFLVSLDDSAKAWKLAQSIPSEKLREEILAGLKPSSVDGLAPGQLRTEAVANDAGKRMDSDPESVIRQLSDAPPGPERDAIYQAVSSRLAGSDPWRLLKVTSSLNGFVGGGVDGTGGDLKLALEYAGRDDPRRALAELREIVARMDNFGGPNDLAKSLVIGWLQKDPVAAITWNAKAGISWDANDLRKALDKAQGGADLFLKLLASDDKSVQGMGRFGLSPFVDAALASGDASALLAKIPQPIADEMLKWNAASAIGKGNFDEGFRIAAMASETARSETILPQMALIAFRQDPPGAVAWLNSLVAADRQHAVAGLRTILSDPSGGGAELEKFQPFIQQLQP